MSLLRRHIIIAAVVAALLIMLARTGMLGTVVQRIALDGAAPVLTALQFPFRAAGTVWDTIAGARRLRAENQALRVRVSELEYAYNSQAALVERTRQLEDLVRLRQEYQFPLLSARIVLRDELAWSKTIIVDRGRSDGVEAGMAVVSGAGLVGQVIEAGREYARVLLVTDRNFKAGGRLRQSRAAGLVEGQGADEMMLNYLSREAAVAPGEEVVTAGVGGAFPAGILVGKVKETFAEEYGFYKYATIVPAVRLDTLEIVAVVLRQPSAIDVTVEQGP
ncbi:rod shape-determining protein MreC [bacterium]|nr:rod shape-determining protein MreC [bacterium]